MKRREISTDASCILSYLCKASVHYPASIHEIYNFPKSFIFRPR